MAGPLRFVCWAGRCSSSVQDRYQRLPTQAHAYFPRRPVSDEAIPHFRQLGHMECICRHLLYPTPNVNFSDFAFFLRFSIPPAALAFPSPLRWLILDNVIDLHEAAALHIAPTSKGGLIGPPDLANIYAQSLRLA